MKPVLLCVIFLTSCIVPGNGAEKVWSGGVSSNWFDADNWEPPGVPAAEDDVTVTTTNGTLPTVTVPADVTIAALNFDTGTINTTNTITVTNLTWGPKTASPTATFNGAGRVLIPPEGTLVFRGDSSCLMRTGVVENLGRAVNVSGRSLLLFNQAVFHNAGTFEIHTNFYFDGANGPPGGVFSNSGTLVVTGVTTRVNFLHVDFHNSGHTDLTRGLFTCDNGSSGGPISIGLMATQQVIGPTFTLGAGASFHGPGLFLHTRGTINAGTNDVHFPNYRFEQGKLTGTNTFVISNFLWAGGEIGGSGLLRIPEDGTLNIVSGNAKALTQRELRHEGNGVQGNSGLAGSYDIALSSGGLFHNAGTLLTVRGYWVSGGPGPERGFYNSGTLIRTNEFDETVFYAPVTNAGRVVILGGRLRPQFGYVQIAGSTELGNSARLDSFFCLIRGGKLMGEGRISGSVVNYGDILPGNPVGALEISGSFTNHGRIFIETRQSQGARTDQIIVSSSARLGGKMSVYWRDMPPSAGFSAISCGSRIGTFARIDGLDLGRGWTLVPNYTPTGLSFVVQPASGAPTNHLSLTPCPDDDFQIRFTGTPGQNYEIEGTDDFIQWTPLWQTNTPNGFISFVDDSASEHPHRFYRAVQRQ